MLDMKAWLDRAVAFAERLQALPDVEVEIEVAPPMAAVFTQIFDMSTIHGGATLLSYWGSLRQYQEWCENLAPYMEEPEERELWETSIPFTWTQTGDSLALALGKDSSDPPVAYLSHEGMGDTCLIAENFERFLAAWERLCYVGPDLWMLSKFRNPATGMIDPESPEGDQLRRAFGLLA